MKLLYISSLATLILCNIGCTDSSNTQTSYYNLNNDTVCVKHNTQRIQKDTGREELSLSSNIIPCSDFNFDNIKDDDVILSGDVLYTQFIQSCSTKGVGYSFIKTGEYINYNLPKNICTSINVRITSIQETNNGHCKIELPIIKTNYSPISCNEVFLSESI